MFIAILLRIFIIVLKETGDKPAMYGHGGNWGAKFIPRGSSFLLCLKAKIEWFSEDIIYVCKFSYTTVWLTCSSSVKRAWAICFVTESRHHLCLACARGCAGHHEAWNPFRLPPGASWELGGRRLAVLLACVHLPVHEQGQALALLAQGSVAHSLPWLPFALASWAGGSSVVIRS